MNVTDMDREKARQILSQPPGYRGSSVTAAIAQALAEERERARKPFIKLAHRYGEEGADSMRQGAGVYSQIARDLRRAAEEPTE